MKKIGLFLLVIALSFCATSCTQVITPQATALIEVGCSAVIDIATRFAAGEAVPNARMTSSEDPSTGRESLNYTYSGCASTTPLVTNIKGIGTIVASSGTEGSYDGGFNINLENFYYDGKDHKMNLQAVFSGNTPTSVENIQYTSIILDGVKYKF